MPIKQSKPYTAELIADHIANKEMSPNTKYPYRENCEFWGEVLKLIKGRRTSMGFTRYYGNVAIRYQINLEVTDVSITTRGGRRDWLSKIEDKADISVRGILEELHTSDEDELPEELTQAIDKIVLRKSKK